MKHDVRDYEYFVVLGYSINSDFARCISETDQNHVTFLSNNSRGTHKKCVAVRTNRRFETTSPLRFGITPEAKAGFCPGGA